MSHLPEMGEDDASGRVSKSKKLLATIKVSDNHKPPSGLIGPSQQLEEEVWEA